VTTGGISILQQQLAVITHIKPKYTVHAVCTWTSLSDHTGNSCACTVHTSESVLWCCIQYFRLIFLISITGAGSHCCNRRRIKNAGEAFSAFNPNGVECQAINVTGNQAVTQCWMNTSSHKEQQSLTHLPTRPDRAVIKQDGLHQLYRSHTHRQTQETLYALGRIK